MSALKVTFDLPSVAADQLPIRGVAVSLAVVPTDPAQTPTFGSMGEVAAPGTEYDQPSIDPGDYIVRLTVVDTAGNTGSPVDTKFNVPLPVPVTRGPGQVTNVVVSVT